ncbi:MAG: hypothetical protein ALECFALPRED_002684 [Alectoria fallacina]|uniref:Uncharacterized protein n=1 Tax=Alectoria fallacina TaxID=1903189 RepID=A0A8H3FI60_9LECA|nr:MAG: hypothetical protein ALECFALPRED_002684 [Alectoria fallacina]
MMTTTSPTFLPLIPEMHHMDNGSHESGPIDRVTLNLAVESLSYHVTSGNSLGSEAQSLKTTSIENEASVGQSDGTYTKQNKTEPAPIEDTPTDSMSALSVKTHHDTASSPKVQKASQDTVATSLPTEFMSPATNLKRRLVNTKDLIVCPGVYDGFSARIALSVGFDALYMTGAGTTASRLGQPDLGLAQLSDMRAHADMIANLDPAGTPLIADMDTGYGGPNTITLAVQQYIRANVAGFHIEDQVLTKRCGHLSGKKVVSADVYLSRIRAAKAAIDKAHSDIVLIARTDALQQLGYDECVARLHAARALGADVGLLEGFKDKEQAARAVKEFAPWPLLLNIVENGHSPLFTVDEAREMGFRIIIFSFAGLAPAYGAIKGAYDKLKREGVTGIQGSGITPKEIFDVCGLGECMRVDEEAGGEDFKGGV